MSDVEQALDEALCDICHERPATLIVPVFRSAQRMDGFGREQTRTEYWCEPCRDRVFPRDSGGYAWKHAERGWLR